MIKLQIIDNIKNKNTHLIKFNEYNPEICPGHYANVCIDGKINSYSYINNNPVTFLVKPVGEFSEKLARAKIGMYVDMDPKLGIPIPSYYASNTVLIGFGTGIAPINFYCEKYKISTFMHISLKDEELYNNILYSENVRIINCYEDAVDDILKYIKHVGYNNIIMCGPYNTLKFCKDCMPGNINIYRLSHMVEPLR